MDKECLEKPSPELLEGIAQFNRGEYYECHETLEDIWRMETGPIREFYKGILQVGVAVHHARRGNLKGARRLVDSGTDLLKPFEPRCMGVDVANLLEAAARFRKGLDAFPPGAEVNIEVVPVIRFAE